MREQFVNEFISTSNADWYSVFSKIVDICKSKGIRPIFAQISYTSTHNNWYKNRIIEHSGYRFVNFAEYVGTSKTGSGWNGGLLSGDNVYPTETETKILANQLLIDSNETIK